MTENDPLAGLTLVTDWTPRDTRNDPEWAPWHRVSEQWSPDAALERIDARANMVLGNVALVGTLASGLGLLALPLLPSNLRPWALGSAALLSLALLLAIAAVLPSWHSSLPISDLSALRQYYNRHIRVRGWLIRFSLLFFAAALLVGAGLAASSLTRQIKPSLTLEVAGEGSEAALSGGVTAKSIPSDASTEAILSAIDERGVRPVGKGVAQPASDGTVTVKLTVKPIPPADKYRLTFAVRQRSRTLLIESLDLTR
jgi:hypothetical protein